MPEIFPTQKGPDPLFDGKSVDELDALLNSMTPEGDIVVETAPEPEPEAPKEEAAPAIEEAPKEEEAAAEETPMPTPDEVELAASQMEGDRIDREKLRAALALQEAHSSRLAGEIGYLKQKLASIPTSSEPYEPQTQAEVDRLSALEERFASSESQRISVQVSQVIESELNALDGPWMQELAAEVQQIAPKYVDQIQAVRESGNPELARLMSQAIGLKIKAEAEGMRWDSNHRALVEKKASTAGSNIVAKKATAPSGSGSVPAPVPKLKSAADMTAAEADAWLRENVL